MNSQYEQHLCEKLFAWAAEKKGDSRVKVSWTPSSRNRSEIFMVSGVATAEVFTKSVATRRARRLCDKVNQFLRAKQRVEGAL